MTDNVDVSVFGVVIEEPVSIYGRRIGFKELGSDAVVLFAEAASTKAHMVVHYKGKRNDTREVESVCVHEDGVDVLTRRVG